MQPPLFTSTEDWNPERIHALAIYCSDGRWGEAFDEFCQCGLHLPRYDRFAVPGGPAWLTVRDTALLAPFSAARDQLQLLVEVHELERIVLVTHYGCAFYAKMLGKDPDGCLPIQEEDVRVGASTLRIWFSGIQVDAFVAMRSEERLSFHPVPV
jgi:hypothetical protein